MNSGSEFLGERYLGCKDRMLLLLLSSWGACCTSTMKKKRSGRQPLLIKHNCMCGSYGPLLSFSRWSFSVLLWVWQLRLESLFLENTTLARLRFWQKFEMLYMTESRLHAQDDEVQRAGHLSQRRDAASASLLRSAYIPSVYYIPLTLLVGRK